MSKPQRPILYDSVEEEQDGQEIPDFHQASAAGRVQEDGSQGHSHLSHSTTFSHAVGLNAKNPPRHTTQMDLGDLLVVHNGNDSEQEQDQARGHSDDIGGEELGMNGAIKRSNDLTPYRMAVDAVKTMKSAPQHSSANGSDGKSNNGPMNSPAGSTTGSSSTSLNNDLIRSFAKTQLERRHTPASIDLWTAHDDVRPSTGVGRHNNSTSSRGGTGNSHDSSRGSSRGTGGSAVGKSFDSNDVDEYRERANGSYGIAGATDQNKVSSALNLLRPSTAAAAVSQRPIFANIVHVCAFSTWGDPTFLGLSGMAAMDGKLEEFQLPVPGNMYGLLFSFNNVLFNYIFSLII